MVSLFAHFLLVFCLNFHLFLVFIWPSCSLFNVFSCAHFAGFSSFLIDKEENGMECRYFYRRRLLRFRNFAHSWWCTQITVREFNFPWQAQFFLFSNPNKRRRSFTFNFQLHIMLNLGFNAVRFITLCGVDALFISHHSNIHNRFYGIFSNLFVTLTKDKVCFFELFKFCSRIKGILIKVSNWTVNRPTYYTIRFLILYSLYIPMQYEQFNICPCWF